MYFFYEFLPMITIFCEIRLLKLPSPSEPGAGWCRICTALLRPGFGSVASSLCRDNIDKERLILSVHFILRAISQFEMCYIHLGV